MSTFGEQAHEASREALIQAQWNYARELYGEDGPNSDPHANRELVAFAAYLDDSDIDPRDESDSALLAAFDDFQDELHDPLGLEEFDRIQSS